jgi:hypothetical protein
MAGSSRAKRAQEQLIMIRAAKQRRKEKDAAALKKQQILEARDIHPLETAAAFGAQGITAGFSDEILAKLKGIPVEEQRAILEEQRRQNPTTAAISKFAGAALPFFAPPLRAASLVGQTALGAGAALAQATGASEDLGKDASSIALQTAGGGLLGLATGGLGSLFAQGLRASKAEAAGAVTLAAKKSAEAIKNEAVGVGAGVSPGLGAQITGKVVEGQFPASLQRAINGEFGHKAEELALKASRDFIKTNEKLSKPLTFAERESVIAARDVDVAIAASQVKQVLFEQGAKKVAPKPVKDPSSISNLVAAFTGGSVNAAKRLGEVAKEQLGSKFVPTPAGGIGAVAVPVGSSAIGSRFE